MQLLQAITPAATCSKWRPAPEGTRLTAVSEFSVETPSEVWGVWAARRTLLLAGELARSVVDAHDSSASTNE